MSDLMNEAFQALKILDEDTFTINADGSADLKNFMDNDIHDELELVIDPLAETEEDIQESYLGKAILDCTICHSKVYKEPEEVIIDEETGLANVGETCVYCQASDGYKVIGQVAEFCPHCDEEPEVVADTDVSVDVEEKPLEEAKTLDDIDADMDDKKEKAEAELAKTKDDARSDRDYQVKKDLKEDIENVSIETEDQKITVSAEDKEEHIEDEEECEGEMIEPVAIETEEKFKSQEDDSDKFDDVDIDEFNEEEFDELGESYLKRVYENVKSYKTVKAATKGNKLKLEGIITFKSGKQGRTNFVFEARSITKSGKLKFLGENKQFARGKKAFTLTGKADGKKLCCESLTYNYRARDEKNGQSKRLYGRVCR